MPAYERLPDRSEILKLLLRKREAQRPLRKNAAVLGDEILPLFLETWFERVPRRAHVRKFRIAAFGWDDVRTKQRISRGNSLVAAVAMPEPIADHVEQALAVLAIEDRI